jgi:hypothetical protein
VRSSSTPPHWLSSARSVGWTSCGTLRTRWLFHLRLQTRFVPALCRTPRESGRFGEPVHVDMLPMVMEWGLRAGETAVLSLAVTSGAVAVIDDRQARRAAQVLGIPVVGTLGIVLQAARDGRVESPAMLVQALRNVGLRLDERAVAHAFQAILGEA